MLYPQEDDLHTHELKSLIPFTINTGNSYILQTAIMKNMAEITKPATQEKANALLMERLAAAELSLIFHSPLLLVSTLMAEH